MVAIQSTIVAIVLLQVAVNAQSPPSDIYYNPVCINTTAAHVSISLQGSYLKANNLGGHGPNLDDEPIIHFAEVGRYDNRILDFVVSVKAGYNYEKVALNTDGNNNRYRCSPEAFAHCDTGHFFHFRQMGQNEVLLKMEIIDHHTLEPVILPALKFGIFDLDQSGSSKQLEEVAVTGYKYSLFYNGEQKEADFAENVVGLHGFCDTAMNNGYNCLVAKSTKQAGDLVCDNPWDPEDVGVVTCNGLQIDRLARSFQVDFEYTSSFDLYFKTHSGNTEPRGYMFILGSTKWDEHCGEELRPELLPY